MPPFYRKIKLLYIHIIRIQHKCIYYIQNDITINKDNTIGSEVGLIRCSALKVYSWS